MNLNEINVRSLNNYINISLVELLKNISYEEIYLPLYVSVYASVRMNIQRKNEIYELS
jgi:hypothetical protein